jgi:hypothetical protein
MRKKCRSHEASVFDCLGIHGGVRHAWEVFSCCRVEDGRFLIPGDQKWGTGHQDEDLRGWRRRLVTGNFTWPSEMEDGPVG